MVQISKKTRKLDVIILGNEIFQRGISILLGDDPNIQVGGTSNYETEALDLVRKVQPDVIVIQLTIEVLDQIVNTIRNSKEISPNAGILVTGYHITKSTKTALLQTILAGATSYTAENLAGEGYIRAIYECNNQVRVDHETALWIINKISELSKSTEGTEFLQKLQILNLDNNRFSGVGLPFDLDKLSSNIIKPFNKIKVIPHEINQLTNLISLDFSNNSLTTLPSEIGQLTKLTNLRLGYNNIISLPEEIGKLSELQFLELDHNRLIGLPISIIKLNRLETLSLRDNPLRIPPEILNKVNEPKTIIAYYSAITGFDSDTNSNPLEKKAILEKLPKNLHQVGIARAINQTKLLIVGQGSVGKTSLVQQILHGTFDQNQTITEGISINQWQVETSQKGEPEDQSESIKLNIWDFGGQEIMHTTHQFFLTKRSLYLLVLDSRLTQEENRVEYWLKIIQSFGGESPVLIIGNKIDQHPLDIDRTGLQKKYPNIIGILETSAATGAGIEELKTAITEQVNKLLHVRDLLPETWFTVKAKLEELGRQSNFITHDKYIDLCCENEIGDEISQRTLIGFLHDLGVVLHFQDDPRLEALGILNPQWVTNGVYKILNSHALFQNKGVLNASMLDEILNLPEYPRGKRLFIVDMMKKFELCYDIETDKTFLVPDLLPKDQPDLNFNGIPAFEYAYPVLPSSVITRFIVRMNQHICDGFVWRTGVLLKMGENTALVKADIEDRKITIAIEGLEHTRRDALSAIRYQLDEIHNSIKGLDAQKRVPIPEAPNAEPLDYDYLLQLERDGDLEFLPVKDGGRLVKVNIRQLLSGIESEAQRRNQGGTVTNIYVGGNFDGNLTVGDDNQSIKDSYNKITSAKIDTELKETLKQLAEAVAVMAKSLPAEQATEATDDLSKLVEETTKPAPNKKWYSVSIEGLIKAAENVEKVGEPVINLSRKVLSLLTHSIGNQ
jgi:internalin A